MKNLTYIVIHCTDTPPDRMVTKEMIESWHKSPRYNQDDTITYLGKTYKLANQLPNDYINGKSIHKMIGRGWDRLGYSDMIHRDGVIENITPYNKDNLVQSNEITWGATGVNSISRHIVLVGGWKGKTRSGTWPFFDIFTEPQFLSLDKYLKQSVIDHPEIKIIGHYQVPDAHKTCPNFNVERLCLLLRIPKKNIGL
jgi:hypothetical protein